jgi:hypothetical protein
MIWYLGLSIYTYTPLIVLGLGAFGYLRFAEITTTMKIKVLKFK